MIVYSRVEVGKELMLLYNKEKVEDVLIDKLLEDLREDIRSKMDISKEENYHTNSIEHTGELAILTSKEYKELKHIEEEFYKLGGLTQ